MKVFIKGINGNDSIPEVIALLNEEYIQPLSVDMGEFDFGDSIFTSGLEQLRKNCMRRDMN